MLLPCHFNGQLGNECYVREDLNKTQVNSELPECGIGVFYD